MLKIRHDASWIISHAWSFRFLVLAAIFCGAEAALPLFMEHPPLPRRIFAVVVFLIVSLALVSRVIVQQRPPEFGSDTPSDDQIKTMIHAAVLKATGAAPA